MKASPGNTVFRGHERGVVELIAHEVAYVRLLPSKLMVKWPVKELSRER